MKTLKKSLCLVLALVFVLGLCTFGAGAAVFTDADEINYEDAVTVMQGLGILVGYPDGSFQPAKTVTRAEAAKMIAYMMLGEKYAEKLAAGSAFDDVPETHWAAKYVNFCASKGIIVGYGNGNYGPSDPVTGIQMAKMLLVATGYGEMGEFTGSNWDVNAFSDAVEVGIFDDAETVDFEAPATREETALYVFNTLVAVDQMKWDVDQNKYQYYKAPFGETVWNLDVMKGIVIANQATGEDYTVVEYEYFNNGTAYTSTVNFAVETGADKIGHQVEVYYDYTEKKDADKNYYYDAYLADDISTVYAISNIFAPKALGVLAKEMGYPEENLSTVPVWQNGVFEDLYMDDIMAIPDAFGTAPLSYFTDLSLAQASVISDLTNTGSTTTVKKANGSKDTDSSYLPFDSLILDEEGRLIGAVKDDYEIGTVIEVDDEIAVVELEDGDTREAKIENCYENIAVDDYATVTWCGDVYSFLPTSTQTVEITDIYYGSFFNGMSIMSTKWRDIVIDSENIGAASTADIEVGQTVKFFIDAKFNAFDAVILDTATVSYVLVTKVYDVASSSYGDITWHHMVQGVDAEGNEVNLTVASGATVGAWEVYSTAADAVLAPVVNTLYKTTEFTNYTKLSATGVNAIPGKYTGTESRINSTRQYLTDATTYLYITMDGANLTVEEADFLQKDASTLAFYAGDPTSVGVVSTVWVLSDVPASTASSYIYIRGTYGMGMTEGTKAVDGDVYNYLTVYIDGVKVSYVPVADECWTDDGVWGLYIPAGMYKYSIKDGVYKLTPATSGTEYEYIMLNGEADKDAVYNGKLLKAGSAMNDIDLADYTIVDVSNGYKDAKGYSHAITSASALSAALKADYMVMMYYGLAEVDDVMVPSGVLYVTYCAPVA